MDNPFDRQSEPSYFSPQPTRRGRRQQQRRLSSTESEESTTSSRAGSPEPDAQFALSMGNTPAVENPPASSEPDGGGGAAANEDEDEDDQVAQGGFVLPGLLGFGRPVTRPTNRTSVSETFADNIRRSKPIAIELPPRRLSTVPDRENSPIEHLSARGDIPGGFFPGDSDIQMRHYQPHPFYQDTQRAREQSISLAAAECNKSPVDGQRDAGALLVMPDPSEFPLLDAIGGGTMSVQPDESGNGNTIASYNPLGDHTAPVPTGKYYPTNWENRKKAKAQAQGHAPTSAASSLASALAAAASTPLSEAETPKQTPDIPESQPSQPARSTRKDEPRTRLQQYQREMVMHASFAASTLVRGKASVAASQQSSTGSTSSLDLVALARVQLGKHKPISPRLLPLGSPGPVTPMDLENNNGADGYLAARSLGPDSDREADEVAKALRAEERRRRDGGGSPLNRVKM